MQQTSPSLALAQRFNRGRGGGLVTQILLYLPRYKVGLIGQVLTAESGSVKLRYEKCLQVWGNAKELVNLLLRNT
jgi:hypothetical protein